METAEAWEASACMLSTKGPDENSAITAAIATMLKANPFFEFIKIRY